MPVPEEESEDDTDFEAVAVALEEGQGILNSIETALAQLDDIIDEGENTEFEDEA